MALTVAAGNDLLLVLPHYVPVLYKQGRIRSLCFGEGEEGNQSCYSCALLILSGKQEQKRCCL